MGRRRVTLGPSEKHRSTLNARILPSAICAMKVAIGHDGLLEPGRHRLRANVPD